MSAPKDDAARKVYVLAVLGTTPAILTELLWWLVIHDDADVVGVEIWTTAAVDGRPSGFTDLRIAFEESKIWERLRTAVGDKAGRLPDWERPLKSVRPEDAPSVHNVGSADRTFTTVLFALDDGQYLPDVRSAADAHLIAALLHDRVRTLAKSLPGDIGLAGSLAGGRKTMSAALQGAFELNARPRDRLLHVLTHPKIEASQSVFKRFVVPNVDIERELGIPLKDQLEAYDVPFPLIRHLLRQASKLPAGALDRELDERSYDDVLGRLRRIAAAGTEMLTAEILDGEGKRRPWVLQVRHQSETVERVHLSEREAAVYAAIASFGASGALDVEIHERLRTGGVSYASGREAGAAIDPWTDEPKVSADYFRKAVEQLDNCLEPLLVLGLREFTVESDGRRPVRRRIPAAERVRGLERVLRLGRENVT